MAAQASRTCELLCYLSNKFGKIDNFKLHSIIFDYYYSDRICSAKEILISEVEKLNLTEKWPRPTKSRESDLNTRAAKDVKDILNLWGYLDDNKLLDRIPTFVAADLMFVPSVKLEDGDIRFLYNKLDKLEYTIDGLQRTINDMRSESSAARSVRNFNMNNAASFSLNPSAKNHNVGLGGAKLRVPPNLKDILSKGSGSENQLKSLASSSVDQTENSSASGDEGDFVFPSDAIRRNRKRLRQSQLHENSITPRTAAGSSIHPGGGIHQPGQQQQPPHPSEHRQRSNNLYSSALKSGQKQPVVRVIGRKPQMTFHGINSQIISGVKPLIKKRVFAVGNLNPECTDETLSRYIANMGIQALSVYPAASKFNKCFRVCINAEDIHTFCDSSSWPENVSVRSWIHKKSTGINNNNNVQRDNENNTRPAASPVVPPQADMDPPDLESTIMDIGLTSSWADAPSSPPSSPSQVNIASADVNTESNKC